MIKRLMNFIPLKFCVKYFFEKILSRGLSCQPLEKNHILLGILPLACGGGFLMDERGSFVKNGQDPKNRNMTAHFFSSCRFGLRTFNKSPTALSLRALCRRWICCLTWYRTLLPSFPLAI